MESENSNNNGNSNGVEVMDDDDDVVFIPCDQVERIDNNPINDDAEEELRMLETVIKQICSCKVFGDLCPADFQKHFQEEREKRRREANSKNVPTSMGGWTRMSPDTAKALDLCKGRKTNAIVEKISLDNPASKKPTEASSSNKGAGGGGCGGEHAGHAYEAEKVAPPRTSMMQDELSGYEKWSLPSISLKRSLEDKRNYYVVDPNKPLPLASTAPKSKRMRKEVTLNDGALGLGTSKTFCGSHPQREAGNGFGVGPSSSRNMFPPTFQGNGVKPEPGFLMLYTCTKCTLKFPTFDQLRSHEIFGHFGSKNEASQVQLGCTTTTTTSAPYEDSSVLPHWKPRGGKRCAVCKRVNYFDDDMMECQNLFCMRKFFHMDCLGISRKPEGTWYCSLCRRL